MLGFGFQVAFINQSEQGQHLGSFRLTHYLTVLQYANRMNLRIRVTRRPSSILHFYHLITFDGSVISAQQQDHLRLSARLKQSPSTSTYFTAVH